MSHAHTRHVAYGFFTAVLLAHLREERLGSFGRTAMIAFSPSIFPKAQILFSAKLWTERDM